MGSSALVRAADVGSERTKQGFRFKVEGCNARDGLQVQLLGYNHNYNYNYKQQQQKQQKQQQHQQPRRRHPDYKKTKIFAEFDCARRKRSESPGIVAEPMLKLGRFQLDCNLSLSLDQSTI